MCLDAISGTFHAYHMPDHPVKEAIPFHFDLKSVARFLYDVKACQDFFWVHALLVLVCKLREVVPAQEQLRSLSALHAHTHK